LTLTFRVNATDADVPIETLALSVSSHRPVSTFDASQRKILLDAQSGEEGSYVIAFKATDNGTPQMSGAKTVNVQVTSGPEGLVAQADVVLHSAAPHLLSNPLSTSLYYGFSYRNYAGLRRLCYGCQVQNIQASRASARPDHNLSTLVRRQCGRTPETRLSRKA